MSGNAEKRNRKIELSKETIALKKMREFRNLSVRSVGDLLGDMENGRAEIHGEYLNSFLRALEFDNED